MTTWKEHKRAVAQAAWLAEQEKVETERLRKAGLSMYERIEECDASDSVKDILHRLANGERE